MSDLLGALDADKILLFALIVGAGSAFLMGVLLALYCVLWPRQAKEAQRDWMTAEDYEAAFGSEQRDVPPL